MQLVYSIAPVKWPRNTCWASLTGLQRCSWCILQPQLTGLRTLLERVLPLCRDAVGVFYSPSQLASEHSLGESYRSAEMLLVYFGTPVNWPQNIRWTSLTALQKCTWCILQPQSTGLRTLVGRVLPLCRDAVGVFYRPSPLGQLLMSLFSLLQYVLFFGWFGKCEVSNCTASVLLVFTFRICSKTACSILMYLPASLFSVNFISILVVHPYCSIDTATAWKKLFYSVRFLYDR